MKLNEELMSRKLESVKGKIDSELLEHPVFNEVFRNGCRNSVGMTGKDSYEVIVSEDGKTVRILDEASNITCRDELRDNRYINATTISLDGDALTVDFASGTLHKPDDLRSIGVNVGREFCGVLSTYYSHNIYDQEGIELSHSWYGDEYELGNGTYGAINMYEQVLSSLHHPKFSYNMLPGNPTFCADANSGCTYRTYDNLGMSYQTIAKGIEYGGKTKEYESKVYPVNTEHPESLTLVPYPVAVWSNEKAKYEITFAEYGEKITDVSDRLRESFKAGLESSETKKYNPEMYQTLVRAVNRTMHK